MHTSTLCCPVLIGTTLFAQCAKPVGLSSKNAKAATVSSRKKLPDLFQQATSGRRVPLPPALLPILKKIAAEGCGDDIPWGVWDVRAMDLKGYGRPEIVVEGDRCFAGANNSDRFVFRKKQSKYELLLDDSAARLGFLPTRTNGYRDIVSDHHMSAFVYFRTLYKFDGREYTESQCMVAAKRCTYSGSGEERWLKDWQLTPAKCDWKNESFPPRCVSP